MSDNNFDTMNSFDDDNDLLDMFGDTEGADVEGGDDLSLESGEGFDFGEGFGEGNEEGTDDELGSFDFGEGDDSFGDGDGFDFGSNGFGIEDNSNEENSDSESADEPDTDLDDMLSEFSEGFDADDDGMFGSEDEGGESGENISSEQSDAFGDDFGSGDGFGDESLFSEGGEEQDDASVDAALAALESDGAEDDEIGAVTAEELGFSEFKDDAEVGEVDSSVLRRSSDSSSNGEFDIDSMYVDRPRSGSETGIYIDADAFEFKHIDVKKIAVTPNRIRKAMSIDKLKLSIQNEGLLNPIVVAPTASEGYYVVVKGLRRLLACASVGIGEIPCVVNNKVSVAEIPIVEALYSHSKPYTVQEMIDYIDYLKTEKGIASATYIEHLLNMESGDYSKLMDLIEDDDEEIMTQLLGGQMTIQQAFKKLEQKRKKMSKEEKDNARAQKVYSNTEEYGADRVAGSGETSDDSNSQMDKEEISEIMSSIGDADLLDAEDGEALRKDGDSIKGFQPHKQDPNDRERLDPKLRKAVLARDKNTCKICEQISGQEYTEVLDVHHIHEVYLGGNDDIENLITACTCCHKLIHLWGRGELHVRPFGEMDELEARKFKRIIKLGNVIRKGMAAKGMSKKELKEKDNADTIGRRLKGSSDQVAG